jgi:hypothetical protein
MVGKQIEKHENLFYSIIEVHCESPVRIGQTVHVCELDVESIEYTRLSVTTNLE